MNPLFYLAKRSQKTESRLLRVLDKRGTAHRVLEGIFVAETLKHQPTSHRSRDARTARFGELLALMNLRSMSTRWISESSRHQHFADISNRIATDVHGWHVQPEDPRRLWRDGDDCPVYVTDYQGAVWNVCQHPFRPGLNGDSDISFSPAHNYHRRQIDWVQWTLDEIDPHQE